MQELGAKGFFSMVRAAHTHRQLSLYYHFRRLLIRHIQVHPIADASPALNSLYGRIDPHALTVLAEVPSAPPSPSLLSSSLPAGSCPSFRLPLLELHLCPGLQPSQQVSRHGTDPG